MQISYTYIVWNNVPTFHENRASFWAMRQSMCVIVVSPKWGIPHQGVGQGKATYSTGLGVLCCAAD